VSTSVCCQIALLEAELFRAGKVGPQAKEHINESKRLLVALEAGDNALAVKTAEEILQVCEHADRELESIESNVCHKCLDWLFGDSIEASRLDDAAAYMKRKLEFSKRMKVPRRLSGQGRETHVKGACEGKTGSGTEVNRAPK
jgi:hypothetical protein